MKCFSVLPGLRRGITQKAVGGEKGRPVEAEIPVINISYLAARTKKPKNTMCVLHVITDQKKSMENLIRKENKKTLLISDEFITRLKGEEKDCTT